VNRRAFVTGLGAVLVAPLAAAAQEPRRPRIGYLSNSADVTPLDAVFLGRRWSHGELTTFTEGLPGVAVAILP